MELLVTRQVLEVITSGVRDGQRDDLEYGGSLLAYEDGERTLVAYALPTGSAAEQGPARVRTDAGFQNASIERIRRRWPRLAYVGDWHVHPMWLPQLSAIDRHTATQILQGEAAHRRHLVLLLGTAHARGEPLVLGFIAYAQPDRIARIESVSLQPVEDDGREVRRALRGPLRPLTELLSPPRKARTTRRAPDFVAETASPPAAGGVLDWFGWPLRLLGDALWSYRPLLAEPLLRGMPSSPKKTPMNEPRIYKLRGRATDSEQEAPAESIASEAGLDVARYRDRVRAVPGIDALLGRTVVLVGLGSVGSDLGARLVRLGVRVVGCDPDRLALENLIRWGLPVAMDPHVGRTKAEVWVEELRRTVPDANAEAHPIDVVRDGGRFEAIMERERPSLVVAATDTADSRRVVNAAAARHGTAALFVALADGAASVRIESVPDARHGPCHLCAERAEGIAPEGFGGTRRSRTPYGSEAAPPLSAVAALPIDVAIGTGIATRIAVLLLSGADEGSWFTHREQRGNVLFMSLRTDTWVFDEAWDRLVYQVERDPECPVCGDPEADDAV